MSKRGRGVGKYAHVADIGTHVADIGTHVADIGTYVADIGTYVADVGMQVADIGTYVADVGCGIFSCEDGEVQLRMQKLNNTSAAVALGYIDKANAGELRKKAKDDL